MTTDAPLSEADVWKARAEALEAQLSDGIEATEADWMRICVELTATLREARAAWETFRGATVSEDSRAAADRLDAALTKGADE